jgi:hypothetical protein
MADMLKDVIEFLHARLSEEKALAKECVRWGVDKPGSTLEGAIETSFPEDGAAQALADHYSVKFVQDDTEAKWRMLAAWPDSFGQWNADQAEAARAMKLHMLKLLALPYAEHPEYRIEWKP